MRGSLPLVKSSVSTSVQGSGRDALSVQPVCAAAEAQSACSWCRLGASPRLRLRREGVPAEGFRESPGREGLYWA